ncbi:hypothetical protein AX16_000092 [Volvariella volvacea WC 439]|nr:hypothetical protein AX16_000092 [Volvariella volvacea WC 439]
MRLFSLSSSLLIPSVLAQLPLPSTPYLPPNATAGTQPSTGHPNPQWSTLLGNLLYFYDAQRSGKLPPTNRVSWRNSSAVDDGRDVRLDLSGGYYDAGGYIKLAYPLSHTLMSLCWGAIDYGQGYDLANQTAYLDDALRWGLDWLVKAHPSNSTLYVQVGDVSVDQDYWGGDLDIPTQRPSLQINDTHPGTNAAAAASAAFSSCAALYANRSFNGTYAQQTASLHNSSYADTLLAHAQSLYTFATRSSGGLKNYQDSVPEVADSYPSSSFGDELTLAALFLSWAQNSDELYQEAEALYARYELAGRNDVFNWDSKTPGLTVLFAQIAQSPSGPGSNLSDWKNEAERYFDRIIDNQGPGYLTRGGLLYYDTDSDDNSLNPALNAAMLLNRYAPLATSPEKLQAYQTFAQSQIDYVLGKNPMNMPYIVGSNPNSPQNPHSASASGGDDIERIDEEPERTAYVLYGAVVGGPNKWDKFYDIRSDWPQTEVALDYNAPMLTLAAMHVINDTSDPFFVSLQAGAYEEVRPHGLPCDVVFPSACARDLPRGAKIAIGVTISVVGLFILGGGAYYVYLLRTRSQAK